MGTLPFLALPWYLPQGAAGEGCAEREVCSCVTVHPDMEVRSLVCRTRTLTHALALARVRGTAAKRFEPAFTGPSCYRPTRFPLRKREKKLVKRLAGG